MSASGSQRLVCNVEHMPRLVGEHDPLRRPGEDPAARGDDRRVVVGPGRAGQLEQPLALRKGGRRIRLGIQEYVPVVEGRDEPQMLGPQHPVAEHVPGHVADADNRQFLAIGVDAEITE